MTRRPLPNRRLTRAQLTQAVTALQQQRDAALGQVTAMTQRVAARLEQAADELATSRSVVRQEVAGELRALAASIEEGAGVNRDELDAFFAKAEDVLTDWQPDPYEHPDVMVARAEDEDAELPLADSYYAQASRTLDDGSDAGGYIVPYFLGESWLAPGLREALRAQLAESCRAFDEETRAFLQYFEWRPLGLVDESANPWNDLQQIADAELAVDTPRERALRLRRERNTGPQAKTGIDGHYRRRGSR